MKNKYFIWLLYILAGLIALDFINHSKHIVPYELMDILIFMLLVLSIIQFYVSHSQPVHNKEIAQMEHYMVTNKRMFDSLFRYNLDLVFSLDAKGQITSMNPSGEKLTGYTQNELINMKFESLVEQSSLDSYRQYFERTMNGEPQRGAFTIIGKDGKRFELLVNTVPIIFDDQKLGIIGIAKDVTEEKMLEQRLKDSEQRYRSLFEHNPDAIMSIDMQGRILSLNPSTEWLTGYSRKELMNQSLKLLIPDDEYEQKKHHFAQALAGKPQNFETILHNKSGQQLTLNVTITPIWVNQEIVGAFCIVKNITEQKKMEDRLNYLAYHDPLTNLPNRSMFHEKLEQTLRLAAVHKRMAAIMFLDLDRFKLVNDSLGHLIGDSLLRKVAERLQSNLRPGDLVSRQGGDEFLILMSVNNESEVTETAERILKALSTSFIVEGHEIYISPSIGIALFPSDGRDSSVLLKKADNAMYQAKRKGKNTYQYYNSVLDTSSYDRLKIERHLHKALERNEFILHYQPKVDLATNEVKGLEAMIRWNHPTLGTVPPADFIPIAEETGLIVPIGEWVLRTACLQNKAWQEQGFPPFTISVNLSIRQFYQSNLVSMVANVLKETGLDPRFLELEITESMAMDINAATNILHDLKKLGVHISIDDFGTGYSSLNYLKKMPIDCLKIDQSFVKDLSSTPNVKDIIVAMISMAHNLNLEVVAEGVETEEQLLFLRQNQCDQGQGYLFSKPVPADRMSEYLRARPGIMHR